MTAFRAAAAALTLATALVGSPALAARFSLSKAELLSGRGYERANADAVIFTFAHAAGWDWGDTFFFFDVGSVEQLGQYGGVHMEISTRWRLAPAESDATVAGVFLIGQLDLDRNKVVTKTTPMVGLSLDWRIPGFRFVKTTVQYRDDPKLAGNGFQATLAWNAHFGSRDQWSFEGFADYTGAEGDARPHLHSQPQLLYHASERVAIGVEYQYWRNRLGIDGLHERCPQLMLRWKF